jgi:UDP:flavonoid glycosyltransferase YjiC (YdhE family)
MRALLLPSGIGRAHLTRLVLIARALRRSGVEVAFAFMDQDPTLLAEGFAVFQAPDATVTDFTANLYAAYTPQLVEQCVEQECTAVRAFRPDVLVSDLRPSTAITARLTGAPHVAVANAYMARQFNPVDVLMTGRGAASLAVAGLAGRSLQGVQKRQFATPWRTVARSQGLRGLDSLDDFLEGDLTLLADLPEFCPLAGLQGSTRYIGPLVWEGSEADQSVPEMPAWRDPRLPLIYATTGNTGDGRLIELVAEAYGSDSSCQVLLTTGAYLRVPRATAVGRVRVERFVPGSMALRHSFAAIHCGGNGTTYQALASGVPSVVVPFSNDQRINAWLVKRHRVGVALDVKVLQARQLRAAVEVVQGDPQIGAAVRRFRDLLRRRTDAATAAAAEITGLVTGGSAHSPRAPASASRDPDLG